MKLTKRQLNNLIKSTILNESMPTLGPSGLQDLDLGQNDQWTIKTTGEEIPTDILANIVSLFWKECKANPGKIPFPHYAFFKFLAGDNSPFTLEDLSKVKHGNVYVATLARMLNDAALPYDGKNLRKNGFAMMYKGKPLSFYVINYQVTLGKAGKDAIISAWLETFLSYDQEGLTTEQAKNHLGVTIGEAGKGGRQICSTGTKEALLRPDLNGGKHILINEFDFKRIEGAVGKMGIFNVMNYYAQELGDRTLKAKLTYLAGRALDTFLDLELPSAKPFKFEFIVDSNQRWPKFFDYPYPTNWGSSNNSTVCPPLRGQEDRLNEVIQQLIKRHKT
jgi:hypothetical protein